MEIGIDSFAAVMSGKKDRSISDAQAIRELVDRIVWAEEVGLDVLGIGEHHRKDFLDAAPSHILAAAAMRTQSIKLTSAVTVLSAADPVRVFQNFATVDLLSQGRVEVVVGRGSFTDAFPLFGYRLSDYDELFTEKLELFLQIRDHETVTWKGKFRPALQNQPVYPRPAQEKLPVWLGVGGTPQSFVRAGQLGLPLMVAIIGGETHRFKPLVDLYREAGRKDGFSQDQLKVGVHSLGYVAQDRETAIKEFYPGYAAAMTRIGRERGWPPTTYAHFEAQNGPRGALVVGGPEEVAEKILRHSEALGGIDRFTFQMDVAEMDHARLQKSMEWIGQKVRPLILAGK